MHLAVGEQGDEIEGRAAAEAGAASERPKAPLFQEDIEQAVFEAENGVLGPGLQVLGQKGAVVAGGGQLKPGALWSGTRSRRRIPPCWSRRRTLFRSRPA